MARVEAVVVCLLIVAMDVAAGVLGIYAEKAQNQGRHLRILFIECRQPVRQAYKLGVAAAAVLAASHAIANIVGGCACVCCSGDKLRRSSPNRHMASFALVLTWMVLIVGLALLVLGALPNSKKSMAHCGVMRHNFLSIGGILCFVHALFCLVYYVSANAAAREESGRGSKAVGVHT
ncbi:protein DESIGUAL 3-like [Lolium rigidum]|uniref:protein DESIGUAL 3-like n=1 Tax=Lolium rigidum TaxID=89674 RepID=UPI001F5D9B04|nr:protein DESIGUAL 3-like [Lolium rigidum]